MLSLANQLTIARMVMIPLLITLLLSNHHGWALLVFACAGLTDVLDGLIARRYHQRIRLTGVDHGDASLHGQGISCQPG